MMVGVRNQNCSELVILSLPVLGIPVVSAQFCGPLDINLRLPNLLDR